MERMKDDLVRLGVLSLLPLTPLNQPLLAQSAVASSVAPRLRLRVNRLKS